MKNYAILLVVLSVFFLFGCGDGQHSQQANELNRESILDRVEFVESQLFTEVPKVPRHCDSLDLDKQRIDVGGAELYVEEEGKGTAIVLVNGGPGGTHHYFHPWFSRLKDHARVIYYDQRGCGLSDYKPGAEGYSVEQAVDDLDAIRKAKNIEKWVVLGYSYGGFLAQLYAITYPENLAGLVLLGATPGIPADTGSSRQQEFITENEKAHMKEIRKQLRQLDKEKDLARKDYIQLLIFNNMINGDWKRQHFYKPSRERIAQIALYEWDHDSGFNGILNNSKYGIDFTGTFETNPIPTLILEGKWDLTWGEKKAEILKSNHPNAKLVIFEMAGHNIFDEAPDEFFKVLKEFLVTLPEVPEEKRIAYKAGLEEWHRKRAAFKKEDPGFIFNKVGWGLSSSKKIAKAYSRSWIEKFSVSGDFLRIAFAMYDTENYEEALFLFEKMAASLEGKKNLESEAVALVWQGHMLDLLGKREQAVSRYEKAAQMNITRQWQHGQYRFKYKVSDYARERMKIPFKRIENVDVD